LGRQTGLMVSKLDSLLKGCGIECHPIRDGNGFKAMPGLISAPNSGLDIKGKERKYRYPSQMGHANKIYKKQRQTQLYSYFLFATMRTVMVKNELTCKKSNFFKELMISEYLVSFITKTKLLQIILRQILQF
jgi:hypothetical protein